MSVEDVHCKTDFSSGNTTPRLTGKDILKIAINLVIIYVIGGLILAGVYSKAAPIVYKKEKEEKEAALKRMMPDADKIEVIGTWEPHEKKAELFVAKKADEEIGYIVQGFGKGYSSYINVLTSVDKDLKIKKVSILAHAETPGLGDEIERDYFLDRFKDKGIENLQVVKTETTDKIQAISGATISSRAVTEDAVKKALETLKQRLEGGGKEGNGSHPSEE